MTEGAVTCFWTSMYVTIEVEQNPLIGTDAVQWTLLEIPE